MLVASSGTHSPRQKILSGGLSFQGNQKANGSILLRALVLSLVVHCVILLGSRLLVPPVLSGVANSDQGLYVLLAVGSSASRPLAASYPVAVVPEKVQSQSPKRLAVEKGASNPSVFPGFSRSTVATDLPAAAESSSAAQQARSKEVDALQAAELKETSNAEGVGEYRLSLAREARRFKRYPAVAREKSWEGVVVLTIHASAGAAVPAVSIGQGSGHQELDVQAVEMMENAMRLATVPEKLRGKQFAISLPIHYRLDD